MGWLEDLFNWLGEMYDAVWPFSQWPPEKQPDWFRQGFPVLSLLLVFLLVIFVLADLLGFCSSSSPGPSRGSQPPRSSPAAGVVYLHVISYNRPPCTVTPMADVTVTPDVNQPTARNAEERPGDAYPGACHWDLLFNKGTTVSWGDLRNTSYNGWEIPQQWDGHSPGSSPGTWCNHSFKPTETVQRPPQQDVSCSVTLLTDSTFEVTYQTFAAGINNGVPFSQIAIYPHCLSASVTATFKPEPEPCVGS